MFNKRTQRGFTLIELLVVISVILIASSIIFVSGKGGSGVALSSSQRIISGIAQGARGQAILKGQITRLIIYSENNKAGDPDKYLRFFGLIYADPETLNPSTGEPTKWIAATQGTTLPDGIYFSPSLSSSNGGSNKWSTGNTMNIDFPRRTPQSGSSGDEYYYYEFNANGTMATTPDDFTNNWLVLQGGILKPSGRTVAVTVEDEHEYLRCALIFRRSGTTTLVTDPDDIK